MQQAFTTTRNQLSAGLSVYFGRLAMVQQFQQLVSASCIHRRWPFLSMRVVAIGAEFDQYRYLCKVVLVPSVILLVLQDWIIN